MLETITKVLIHIFKISIEEVHQSYVQKQTQVASHEQLAHAYKSKMGHQRMSCLVLSTLILWSLLGQRPWLRRCQAFPSTISGSSKFGGGSSKLLAGNDQVKCDGPYIPTVVLLICNLTEAMRGGSRKVVVYMELALLLLLF